MANIFDKISDVAEEIWDGWIDLVEEPVGVMINGVSSFWHSVEEPIKKTGAYASKITSSIVDNVKKLNYKNYINFTTNLGNLISDEFIDPLKDKGIWALLPESFKETYIYKAFHKNKKIYIKFEDSEVERIQSTEIEVEEDNVIQQINNLINEQTHPKMRCYNLFNYLIDYDYDKLYLNGAYLDIRKEYEKLIYDYKTNNPIGTLNSDVMKNLYNSLFNVENPNSLSQNRYVGNMMPLVKSINKDYLFNDQRDSIFTAVMNNAIGNWNLNIFLKILKKVLLFDIMAELNDFSVINECQKIRNEDVLDLNKDLSELLRRLTNKNNYYYLTKDTTKQSGKTYYIKQLNGAFTQFNGSSFSSGISYFEKIDVEELFKKVENVYTLLRQIIYTNSVDINDLGKSINIELIAKIIELNASIEKDASLYNIKCYQLSKLIKNDNTMIDIEEDAIILREYIEGLYDYLENNGCNYLKSKRILAIE